MLALAEAQDLDVAQVDGPTGWRYLACGGVKNAVVGPAEGPFLYGDVIDEVNVVDLDVPVGEGGQPAGVELDAGGLSLAAHPARCLEDDVVRQHGGEAFDVVGVKRVGPSLE